MTIIEQTTNPTKDTLILPRTATLKLTAVKKSPAPIRKKPGAEALTKQNKVLTMLRRKEGATVAAIMKATSWQPHSVRGFFAGVVRKKLKLNLVSEGTDGKRIYRIAGAKPVIGSRSRRKASK